MKKFSLLVGAIGSTAAWYILSNKKLREDLGKARNPEETIQILTRYLGRDSEKIGKAVHEWVHSEEIQEGLSKAKDLTGKTIATAKQGLGSFFSKAKEASKSLTDSMKKDDKKKAA